MELRYRREALVGVFIIVATAIFVVGMIWLRGRSFSSGKQVQIIFSDVSGLKVGDPVRTSGVTVGQVRDIRLESPGRVDVLLELSAAPTPRADARATVRSLDFFGAQYVDYQPGVATASLPTGQEIRGQKEQDITGLAQGLSGQGQEVLANAAAFVGPENARELRGLLVEARSAVSQLGSATEAGSREATGALMDLRKVLQRLDLLLGNDAAAQTLEGMRDASRNLAQVTATLQKTSVALDSIMVKINSGRGSVGRMVNDTTLVTDLHAASTALTELLTDLKANPSKYIHVRVF